MTDAADRPRRLSTTRWQLGGCTAFRPDGRNWRIGPHCVDLAWPWWAPWNLDDVWPAGNRPRDRVDWPAPEQLELFACD